jgi:DNA-binding MarR family transcriptional regulator
MTVPTAVAATEPASKDRLRLWLRLLKITRLIEADLRERLRLEFASTLPRFDVMAALNRRDKGLKMSEISSVLKVSNGNVTGIVDRLCDEGLALREAVPGDRRAARVRLTLRGGEEFARQAAAHEAWIDAHLAGLTSAEAGRMDRALNGLARGIEARRG